MKLPAILLTAMLLLCLGCEPPQSPKKSCPPGRKSCPCRATVIAFTAEWCGPCQKAKPALEKLRASGVNVQIVDVDANPELAERYGVTGVPAFFVNIRGTVHRAMDVAGILCLLGR